MLERVLLMLGSDSGLVISSEEPSDHVHYTDQPVKNCKINGNGSCDCRDEQCCKQWQAPTQERLVDAHDDGNRKRKTTLLTASIYLPSWFMAEAGLVSTALG